MNLQPPPVTDDIKVLREWCEDLYEFLKFPAFPGGAITRTQDKDGDTMVQIEESADEDKVRIDAGGSEVAVFEASGNTQPLQPCFRVIPASDQTNIAADASWVTVVWGTETFDVGSDFASNTFTAPVTGKYLFTVFLQLNDLDSGADYYALALAIGPTPTLYPLDVVDPGQLAGDPAYWSMGGTMIFNLTAAETVTVRLAQVSGTQQTDIDTNSYFCGQLIS
jgi:hypothetical protein